MKTYLVGGAVRDQLLGLKPHERDWVVVGATEAQMLQQGFRYKAEGFPVFLHPETGEEYALARREIKSGQGYKGFRFDSGPDVTLEEDLKRRDLTINAIAMDPSGQLVDPFGGGDDLSVRMLRHVSDAFVEDPVRLLRAARFAARFDRFGFRLSHDTFQLLKQIVVSGELSTITRGRLWRETWRAMSARNPGKYFHQLHRCGALAQLLPSLAEAIGDTTAHGDESAAVDAPLNALKKVAAVSESEALRLAAVLFKLDRLDRVEFEGLAPTVSQWLMRAHKAAAALASMPADAAAAVRFIDAMHGYRETDEFEELMQLLGACLADNTSLLEWLRQCRQRSADVRLSASDLAETEGRARAERLIEKRIGKILDLS